MSANTPWTTRDDDRLRRCLAAGAVPSDVAHITGRDRMTVVARAGHLDLEWRSHTHRSRAERQQALATVAAIFAPAAAAAAASDARDLRRRNADAYAAWRERQRDPRPAPWESAA